MFKTIKI